MAHIRLLVVVVLATALYSIASASPASAASVVVQDRFVGSDLIAHRYEAPATGNETLTVVARKTPDHNPTGWNTITLFDFDRDGKADGAIRSPGAPRRRFCRWTSRSPAPPASSARSSCARCATAGTA